MFLILHSSIPKIVSIIIIHYFSRSTIIQMFKLLHYYAKFVVNFIQVDFSIANLVLKFNQILLLIILYTTHFILFII